MIFVLKNIPWCLLLVAFFNYAFGMQKVNYLSNSDQAIKTMVARFLIEPDLKKSFFNLMQWAYADKRTYGELVNQVNIQFFVTHYLEKFKCVANLKRYFASQSYDEKWQLKNNLMHFLIAMKIDLEKITDKSGRSLLSHLVSCKNNDYLGSDRILLSQKHYDIEFLKKLVSSGCNLGDMLNSYNKEPLLVATYKVQKQIIELLCQAGINVDLQREESCKFTALMIACRGGWLDCISILLEYGADVNVTNDENETALFLTKSIGLQALLLKAGANPNVPNKQGITPLMQVIRRHSRIKERQFNMNCYEIEIEELPPVKNEMITIMDTVHQLIDYQANVTVKDQEGKTALHYAAEEDCSFVCQALLDANSDLESQDNQGRTPLFYAVKNRCWPAVRILLQRKANPDAIDMDGNTPLLLALDIKGHFKSKKSRRFLHADQLKLDIIQLLLKAKANPNKKNYDGVSPLSYAKQKKDFMAQKLMAPKLLTKKKYSQSKCVLL